MTTTMTCDEIDDDRYRSLFNLHFSVEMKGSKITLYNLSDILKSGDTCTIHFIVLCTDNHTVSVTSFSGRNMQFIQIIFSHKFDSLLLSIPSVEINLKPFKFAIII